MAPPSKDPSSRLDGFLTDTNSIPLCKILIERSSQLEDVYDVDLKPFARGKFATVKRCTHRSTNVSYAAKIIKKRRMCQDVTHEILHEIRVLMLSTTKSDRIVQLHQVFESSRDYILVLELASGGELQKVLDEEEFLPENTCRIVMRQVLEGIAFLHDLQIAHLDIKPQNILLTHPLPHCDIKICDFGISRLITKGSDLREIIGTPDYVAPEILNYEPISLQTDMWSIGCLAYVLLSGCSPFGGDDKQETFCNITSAALDFPVQYFGEVSDRAIDFITKLIVKDPKRRLSCLEAQRHEWLSSSSSTTIEPLTDTTNETTCTNISNITTTSTDITTKMNTTCTNDNTTTIDNVDTSSSIDNLHHHHNHIHQHNNDNDTHCNDNSNNNHILDNHLIHQNDEHHRKNTVNSDGEEDGVDRDDGLPSTDDDDRLSSSSSTSDSTALSTSSSSSTP